MRWTIIAVAYGALLIGCHPKRSAVKVDIGADHISSAEAASAEALIEAPLRDALAEAVKLPANVDCSNQDALITMMIGAWFRNDYAATKNAKNECLSKDPQAFQRMPVAGAYIALMMYYDQDAEVSNSAIDMFETIANSASDAASDKKLILFNYLYLSREKATNLILASPLWNESQKASLSEMLADDASSDSKFDQNGLVRSFIEGELADPTNTESYKGALLARAVREFNHRKHYSTIIRLIAAHSNNLKMGFFMQSLSDLFDSFYVIPDSGPSLAGNLYSIYIPYADRTWELPTQQNPHTYSELYSSICRDHLLSDSPLKDKFTSLRKAWRSGRLTTGEALTQALAMKNKAPDKADLLTLIGTLLLAFGQVEKASDTFWQAHLDCIFYNRAHDGLNNVMSITKKRASPNYGKNLAAQKNALSSINAPASLAKYVYGYSNLESDERVAVQLGLKFWFPYLDSLAAKKYLLTIVWPDTLLSEVPGLSGLHDTRAVEKPFDNRLDDDVAGLDGQATVVRLSNIIESVAIEEVYDRGSTITHEVAHQFQGEYGDLLTPCIKALYDQGTVRKCIYYCLCIVQP